MRCEVRSKDFPSKRRGFGVKYCCTSIEISLYFANRSLRSLDASCGVRDDELTNALKDKNQRCPDNQGDIIDLEPDLCIQFDCIFMWWDQYGCHTYSLWDACHHPEGIRSGERPMGNLLHTPISNIYDPHVSLTWGVNTQLFREEQRRCDAAVLRSIYSFGIIWCQYTAISRRAASL